MSFSLICVLYFSLMFMGASSRIHKLTIMDDDRHYVALSTFGFYQGGILDVKLENFMLPVDKNYGVYGFTLDRTVNDAMSPYLDANMDSCLLQKPVSVVSSPQHPAIVYFKMDLENLRMNIECQGDVRALHLYSNRALIPIERTKRHSLFLLNRIKRDLEGSISRERRNANEDDSKKSSFDNTCSTTVLPITKETKNGHNFFNASFAMYVASMHEEGLYNLYFHNCPPKERQSPSMYFTVEIFESNDGNFLSAGEMPLPALYSMMSLLFFLSAGFWTFILRTSRHPVYRIHIIMCVLVYLKALSLAFHGINYHFIQTKGEHVPAWAILYYVTHLLKGAVLFVTIVLVGTGWNFIKHILADRDKKLFMIVIPLQVVANVAEIILEESEEGAAEHNVWRDIFILVDILCCGAILFPVVWSIRHLQDASSTDGKAAINLRKLKLFRHFYIMVVCYIYFTRIIVYLLKITVAFQYSWIDEMFREMATFVFFVTTGYKFRPASANPYFTPTLLDDVEPQVLSEIGVLDGVSKVSNRNERSREDRQPLIHENNHEYD